MEYQKVINLWPQINELNLVQKNWVETNDDSRGTYNTNSQTKFEISMVKSNLCDYSDAYIHVERTIKGVGDDAAAREEDQKIKG